VANTFESQDVPRAGIREDVWIPMPDGVRLAATIYRPDPKLGPQPCLVEALPYRKDDVYSANAGEYMRLRDEYNYAVCRIDVRGTGSSAGRAMDEYPATERGDLTAAVAWLAEQAWCTGDIGMYGTSYSGCAALLTACERPPALKAIVAIQGPDDPYTDDVHYRGGALQLIDLIDYPSYMTTLNALPPVPAVWGQGWRDEWTARLAEHEPWLLRWLREQRDSAYWRGQSARTDLSRIACPTMVVAGWADGYRNATFRILSALRSNGVPHRLLAGPWAHGALDTTRPGPRIDEIEESVRWWDRWLRGIDNGVSDGLNDSPSMTVFVRTSTIPAPALDTHEGVWIQEEWPSPRIDTEVVSFSERPAYVVDPSVGVDAWIDCAGTMPWGQSGDLRFDDAASLTWEFDGSERTLLGRPRVRLRLTVDAPVAQLSAKLTDVFPDGTSALITRGLINLTHRDDHANPTPLVPGASYDIDLEMDACAYRFIPGQHLRLSIAGADWPNNLAPPAPVMLTVQGGEIHLPTLAGPSPHQSPTVAELPNARPDLSLDDCEWRITRDVLKRIVRASVDYGSKFVGRFDNGIIERNSGFVSIDARTFQQEAQAESLYQIDWPEASVTIVSSLHLVADAQEFAIDITLAASENGDTVFMRDWSERLPRDLA
jgi:putative CocE/NonD family hydrolase